jgi:hypothetical protein
MVEVGIIGIGFKGVQYLPNITEDATIPPA